MGRDLQHHRDDARRLHSSPTLSAFGATPREQGPLCFLQRHPTYLLLCLSLETQNETCSWKSFAGNDESNAPQTITPTRDPREILQCNLAWLIATYQPYPILPYNPFHQLVSLTSKLLLSGVSALLPPTNTSKVSFSIIHAILASS